MLLMMGLEEMLLMNDLNSQWDVSQEGGNG